MDGTTQLSAEDLMGWSKARELASQQGRILVRPLAPGHPPSPTPFLYWLDWQGSLSSFVFTPKGCSLAQPGVTIMLLSFCPPSANRQRQGHSYCHSHRLNIYQPHPLPSKVVSVSAFHQWQFSNCLASELTTLTTCCRLRNWTLGYCAL